MGMGINRRARRVLREPTTGGLQVRKKESQMTWKSRLISAALAVGILAAFALSAGTDYFW